MPFKTREAKRKEAAQIMAKNKWGKGFDIVSKEVEVKLTSPFSGMKVLSVKGKRTQTTHGAKYIATGSVNGLPHSFDLEYAVAQKELSANWKAVSGSKNVAFQLLLKKTSGGRSGRLTLTGTEFDAISVSFDQQQGKNLKNGIV